MTAYNSRYHLQRWWRNFQAIISRDDNRKCRPPSLTHEDSRPYSIAEMIPHFQRRHLWRWYLENRAVISGDDTLNIAPSSLEMTTLKYTASSLWRWFRVFVTSPRAEIPLYTESSPIEMITCITRYHFQFRDDVLLYKDSSLGDDPGR